MKILYITGGLTPYRIAFCDQVNQILTENKLGELKLFLLSEEGFNSNYNNNQLMRNYAAFIPGKTVVLRDGTTRFMINPSIAKKVIEYSPDLVILGGSWLHPTSWILLLNKRKIGVPIYFWSESHFRNGIKRKKKKVILEVLRKKVYDCFDGFFVPGKYAKEAIESTQCKNAANCIQLPNLVENTKYYTAFLNQANKDCLRDKYGVSKRQIVLFSPSRLVDIKGIVDFIKNGVDELKDPIFTWFIAGIGPLHDEIEQLARNYHLDIRMLGFIDQSSIVECLTLADWFLLPSLSDPNPLSVIEALWSGLPLALSSYVGNLPETLSCGVNGWEFDTLSQKSVIDALIRIKQSNEAWRLMAQKTSIKIAQENFDIRSQSQRFIDNIGNIIDEKKK